MGYEGHFPIKFNEPDESLMLKLKIVRPSSNVQGVIAPCRILQPGLEIPILVPMFASHSQVSQITASVHRFARKMPEWERESIHEFLEYGKRFIVSNWRETLTASDIPGFSEWLEATKYSGARKKYFQRIRDELERIDPRIVRIVSFIKWEGYDEPKQPRAINSPSDESKTLLGAIQHAIDEFTFRNKHFVKHTNPRDWPTKLKELFGTSRVAETDFSSFESHHRGPFAYLVYFWMLHMIRHVPGLFHYRALIKQMVLGRRDVTFHDLKLGVDYRLMSGAMWTSSSNGVLNLLLMSYLSAKTACPNSTIEALVDWSVTHYKGLFEGDDGICLAPQDISPKLIASLGLDLKLSYQSDFSHAKFCGITCDMDALVIIKDPISVLKKFFCLPPRYRNAKPSVMMALLRARALSYKCNFQNCPIIGPLCDHICELTRSYTPKCDDAVLSYEGEKYMNLALNEGLHKVKAKVSDTTRALVERRFHVSVPQQKMIEQKFDGVTKLLEIDMLQFVNRDLYYYATEFQANDETSWTMPKAAYVPKFVQQVLNDKLRKPIRLDKKCQRVNILFRDNPLMVPPVDAGVP